MKKVKIPTACPLCGKQLERIQEEATCHNNKCQYIAILEEGDNELVELMDVDKNGRLIIVTGGRNRTYYLNTETDKEIDLLDRPMTVSEIKNKDYIKWMVLV